MRPILTGLLLLAAINVSNGFAAERPNIVVFLVDDLGWQDTSVAFGPEPTPQNAHFHTPHLEQLAAHGVRFTQAYACTVCSPTRTSLMTGRNAARHGVTNWTLYADRETSATTPRLEAPSHWRREGLQPPATTLPQLLCDERGYRTIHVGKAHWGAFGTPGADPRNLGFDVNIAGHSAGAPGHYHGEQNYGNQAPHEYTPPWGVPGLSSYHGSSTHLTDALTVEANRAVADAVAAGQPFFLYMAHYAVHAPIQPHHRFTSRYADQMYQGTEIRIPVAEVNYASMVEGVDASLGAILKQLEDLGVARQTIVLFLSDNGGLTRHARGTTALGTGRDTHCWPLREGKGSAYEGGTRVPMVLAWAKPDAQEVLQQQLPIAAASVCTAPVIVEDVVPTVLHWAGDATLAARLPDCDGVDFTPAVLGESAFTARAEQRPLVFHYPHQWSGSIEGGYQPHSSIRQDGWKAIYFYEGQRWELYNLRDDIGESDNRAAEDPQRLEQLAAMLKSELQRMGALWPVNRHTGQPEPLRLPDEIRYPNQDWTTVSAATAGIKPGQLQQVAEYLGGRGVITYDGRIVHQWGDISRPDDVASAVKPIFTHLLIEAVESGRLNSFEEPLVGYEPRLDSLNRELDFKDRFITFRHCANQISCYGVSESPGEAFDYNDFQMALFFDTLVGDVYQSDVSAVDRQVLHPLLTDRLQCQDNPSLLAFGDGDRAGRLRISPRDFCRLGLLYLHEGVWRGETLIAPAYARTVTRTPLPLSLPRTKARAAEMISGQRTLGSRQIPDDQTDHLGSYSWAWWVNGRRASGQRLWPDAPEEVYSCLGHKHGKRGMMVIPAWRVVMSWNDSRLDEYPWEDPSQDPHPLNEVFRLLHPHD